MTFKIIATIMNQPETADAVTGAEACDIGDAFFARHASSVSILAPGQPIPFSVEGMRKSIERGEYA